MVDSFVLVVRNSKTIQFGQSVLQIPFVACFDLELSPVRAVLSHLTTSRMPPDVPLFAFLAGGHTVVLTQVDFVTKLRVGLTRIGLNAINFSGHNLRRGDELWPLLWDLVSLI
jgi:hypothetical protein